MNKVKPSECPACGKRNDAATARDGSNIEPQVGDIAVCFSCGCINKYGFDMVLELVPADEIAVDNMEPARAARDERAGGRAAHRARLCWQC